MILTYLFVPAHEGLKVLKAMASGSDAVILDLEASVPESRKEAGRQGIREYLSTFRKPDDPEVWIRVNEASSEFMADAKAVDWRAVAGAVVPKAEDPGALRTLVDAGAERLIPLIESAAGFRALDRLAKIATVERFAIGTWDLMLDLGLLAVPAADDSELIWQLRGELVVASRQLGLESPVDGVYGSLDDDTGLRVVCERAHRLGYASKLLIHPCQIAAARSVFGPNDEDLRFAREMVDAYERAVMAGRGAIQIRGQMIDRPIVERARALLARWPSTVPYAVTKVSETGVVRS
jgi:citrate lyase beta subunit